jgi:hypothetical protein
MRAWESAGDPQRDGLIMINCSNHSKCIEVSRINELCPNAVISHSVLDPRIEVSSVSERLGTTQLAAHSQPPLSSP